MLHEKILLVRDQNYFGNVYNEFTLHFDRLEVTVRDIITERVCQEVQIYNQKLINPPPFLVTPKDEEVRLNNPTGKKKFLPINAEKQVEVALQAFYGNGFFMLVDDVQVEELDERVMIKPDTVVSFIKLTVLVGG